MSTNMRGLLCEGVMLWVPLDLGLWCILANSIVTSTRHFFLQETQNRNEAMRGEESSKVTAGKRYEDHRRGLEQSLKTKQDSLAVRQRQGTLRGSAPGIWYQSLSVTVLTTQPYCTVCPVAISSDWSQA